MVNQDETAAVREFLLALEHGATAARSQPSVRERREAIERLNVRAFGPLDLGRYEDVLIEEAGVPADDGRVIPVRTFRPRVPGTRPALLFFFGGAFWMRNFDSPEVVAICAAMARDAGVVVIEVDYSLAPERPYPAALFDGYTVLNWVASHSEQLEVAPDKIAVGGHSAGGCLSAGLCLLARDRQGPPIALQILEVPATDLTWRTLLDAEGADLEIPDLHEASALYFGDEPDRAVEGYASPLLASRYDGLPPALILTAEEDLLRHEGLAYAQALTAAGTTVVAVTYARQVHLAPSLFPLSASSRAWRAQVMWALRSLADGAPLG